MASACGAETRVDFDGFARLRQPLLQELLFLDNGLPSHDTFSQVFQMLEPDAFGRGPAARLDALGADTEGMQVIAGKTLRRLLDRAVGIALSGIRRCMW